MQAAHTDASSSQQSNLSLSQAKKRSRAGCMACRLTRIKCDEGHPVCGRCSDRDIPCEWPPQITGVRKQRDPRPILSCEQCRQRRTRCTEVINSVCQSCRRRGVECRWQTRMRHESSQRSQRSSSSPFSRQEETTTAEAAPLQPEHLVGGSRLIDLGIPPSLTSSVDAAAAPLTSTPRSMGESVNIKELIRLYFSTVHYHAYLAFIHEADFYERYDQGKVSEDLTLLMAANALRFGGGQLDNQQRLIIADRWVAEVGDRVISLVMTEFGAVELMELVLCYNYDFLNGRYSRGFVMAGMAVRMMTFLRLHILDEFPRPTLKPLLSPESLRRLAWAIWYLDATIDGGNFGFSAIRDGALTIPLPCDERPFLLNIPVVTEHLIPVTMLPSSLEERDLNPTRPMMQPSSSLGLGAHLLRALCARQALADVHSRINRRLIDPACVEEDVRKAIDTTTRLLDTLPVDMRYSRAQLLAYKDQLPVLINLHVMRNTCMRQVVLLEILAAPHIRNGIQHIPERRQSLIRGALELSSILKDAMDYAVVLDPQVAMHAYNGIEILLFQPLRQSMERSRIEITKEQVLNALSPLIQVIRDLARVCELVALIFNKHPEAINRMVQFGYVDHLTNDDIMAVVKKVHSLANADTEFDFHESFWRYELSLIRRRAAANQQQQAESPNDVLLELPPGVSPSSATTAPVWHPAPLNTVGVGVGPGVDVHSNVPTAQPHPIPNSDVDINVDTSASALPMPNESITRLQSFFASTASGYSTPAIFNFQSGSPTADAGALPGGQMATNSMPTFTFEDLKTMLENNVDNSGSSDDVQSRGLANSDIRASNPSIPTVQMPFGWSFWEGQGNI